MNKVRTVVTIAGKEYPVLTTDNVEQVRRAAGYVDRRMHELAIRTGQKADALSTIVALDVAHEMMKAHDEINRLRAEIINLHKRLDKAEKG